MIFISLNLVIGCVSEYYAPPTENCINPGLIANKTIADIYSIAINPVVLPVPTGNVIPDTPIYTTNDILEGYVISSDEGGNFYQSMYFEPLNKSKGFNLSVSIKSAYVKSFIPGKKVYLKMKGLAYANPTNFASGLLFGAPPTDIFVVARLDNYENNLIPSCDAISEDLLVNKITIAQVSDTYLNTLVEIKNIQFTDATAGGTYDTDLTDSNDSNTLITDGVSTPLAIRTSRFSNFASLKTPTKNGSVRGVLTKYNGSYQILLRTERDVKMNNPRVLTPSNPVGGTNLVFGKTLNETFSSFPANSAAPFFTVFPNYINDQLVGGRYWGVKAYGGNNYIEMSSYGGAGVTAKTYFMVPVNFDTAKTFSFKKEARYNKGPVLNIYYLKSTEFVQGFLNKFNLTDITSNFTISYPGLNLSENNFTSSGIYNIDPSLTGTGFFVFEYSGTPTVTTTMQIDDIVIN